MTNPQFQTETFTFDNGLEMTSIVSENEHEERKQGTYEEEVTEWLLDRSDGMDLYCGVGAFVGYIALHLYRQGIPIKAFEPGDAPYHVLEENFASNGSLTAYTLSQRAVLDGSGQTTAGVGGCGFIELESGIDREGTTEVTTTTLNKELFGVTDVKNNIAIKLDTEGCELQVLRGADEIMDSVSYLVVEYHPSYVDEEEIRDTIELIHDSGFKQDDYFNGQNPYQDNMNIAYSK